MASFAKERLEKTLKIIVSDIISRELIDDKLSFVTVTGVELSNDRSHLKVFVSLESAKEISNEKQIMKTLNAARGYIRREIARLENLRRVPEIHFKIDNSFTRSRKIEELLAKINSEKEGDNDE